MGAARDKGDPTEDARRQFGRQAGQYATSLPHARGASLDIMAEWADPQRGEVVLDVATGAGFAAFALAPRAGLVIASDITPQMLDHARNMAAERELANVVFAFTAAENLAFADASIDILTCRVAAHHFPDVRRFVAEAHRVCRQGGRVLLVDTISPEQADLTALMDELERRRDPSHVRNHSVAQWQAIFQGAGFVLRRQAVVRTELRFEDWVRTSGTPADQVANLRALFAKASREAIDTFHIASEGDGWRFAWDTLMLEAVKRG